MSDFKAKMHQIRFRLGGSAPDPKLDLKGPTSKGRGREGRGGVSKGRKGRESRGGKIRPAPQIYSD